MTAYIPLLVCLVGLVIWALAAGNAKPIIAKIGEWMFVIGLFWTLAPLVGSTVHFLR